MMKKLIKKHLTYRCSIGYMTMEPQKKSILQSKRATYSDIDKFYI